MSQPPASGRDRDSTCGAEESDEGTRSLSPPQMLLDRVCRAVADSAGVDGVAVAVMSSTGVRELVFASTAVAQYLDEVQFTVGLGPCLDAFTSKIPVVCTDLRDDLIRQRWLGFADDAAAAGVGSVYAFPLQGGSMVFGVLELYRVAESALSSDENAAAERGAASVAQLIMTYFAATVDPGKPNPTQGRSEMFQSEHARPQINYAAGMVSVQLGVGIDDAMAALRARAYLEHRSLTEIADAVVSRRIRFRDRDRDDGPPNSAESRNSD